MINREGRDYPDDRSHERALRKAGAIPIRGEARFVGADPLRLSVRRRDGDPLELTVSTLPYEKPWASYVERNVNRWMGQLGQGPLPGEVVEKIARKLPLNKGDATVFELVGEMDRVGAMPPGHPPVGAARVVEGGDRRLRRAGALPRPRRRRPQP